MRHTWLLSIVPVAAALATMGAARQQVQASQLYFLVDLGTFGGTQSTAEGIADNGRIVGSASLKDDRAVRAFLWRNDRKTDLGTLGGVNSDEQWPEKDNTGLIVGDAETPNMDPNAEDFCGFDVDSNVPPTGLVCQGFAWRDGQMTALPGLGGNNSQALGVNDSGQVAGFAETSTVDSSCRAPQVLDIEAVVWGPQQQMQVLPPLRGDTMSWAMGIDDAGLVVGASGRCTSPNFNLTGHFPRHAVVWRDGVPINLGDLGAGPTVPWAINSKGQVVGFSYLADGVTQRTFMWQDGVMTDLGTIKSDVQSQAFGMNDLGDVVGASGCGNLCRGYIYHDGVMHDLNARVAPGSAPLYILWGNDINDKGEIGLYTFALRDYANHAAIAIPCSELPDVPGCRNGAQPRAPIALPMEIRARLRSEVPHAFPR